MAGYGIIASGAKGCRLNGKPPVSKTGFQGSNPCTPATALSSARRGAGVVERNCLENSRVMSPVGSNPTLSATIRRFRYGEVA